MTLLTTTGTQVFDQEVASVIHSDRAEKLQRLQLTANRLVVAVEQRLVNIAEFVTRARSVVHKSYDGDAEFAPAPEAPGRFVRQLHGLAAGLAVIHGRST